METTVLIAKILGPLYLVATLGWVMNRDFYKKMIAEFSGNHSVMYISGILAFLFGAVILIFNNVWRADWQVLITIIGWLGLLKGLTILVFPQVMIKYSRAFAENSGLFYFGFAFAFALGAALTWFGYFA